MSKPVYLKLGTCLIAATEGTAPGFIEKGYRAATDEEVEAAAKQHEHALRRFNERNAIEPATHKSADPSKLPKISKPAKKKD